jgi:hypothetical protein
VKLKNQRPGPKGVVEPVKKVNYIMTLISSYCKHKFIVGNLIGIVNITLHRANYFDFVSLNIKPLQLLTDQTWNMLIAIPFGDFPVTQ